MTALEVLRGMRSPELDVIQHRFLVEHLQIEANWLRWCESHPTQNGRMRLPDELARRYAECAGRAAAVFEAEISAIQAEQAEAEGG